MAKAKGLLDQFLHLKGVKNKTGSLNNSQQKRMDHILGKMNTGVQQGPSLPSGHFPQPAKGFKPKDYKHLRSKGSNGDGTGTGGIDISGGWSRDGLLEKSGGMMNWMGNNVTNSLKKGETVLGVAANHAIRGAIGGGAIGGTMEAAQGGSFWDGAKAGAFNGAVGWGGYRMGMRATGSKSLNPFKGMNNKNNTQDQGMFAAMGRMSNTMSTNGNVSRQAAKMLSHEQQIGLQRSIYQDALKI